MTKDDASEIRTIVDILEDAIEKERDSFEYYSNAAKQAGRPAVKKTFLDLAEMEKGHLEQLTKQLADVKAQTMIDRAMTGDY